MNEVPECMNLIDLDGGGGMETNSTSNTNTTTPSLSLSSSSSVTSLLTSSVQSMASSMPSQMNTPCQLMDFQSVEEEVKEGATSNNSNVEQNNRVHNIPLLMMGENQSLHPEVNDPFESEPIGCLDNNPFDLLEHVVNENQRNNPHRKDDAKPMDIKTAKLLALSDDELLEEEEKEVAEEEMCCPDGDVNLLDISIPVNGMESVTEDNGEDVATTVNGDGQPSSIPSSTLLIRANEANGEMSSSESDYSTDSSVSRGNNNQRKKITSRNRLLKLSLTNSANSILTTSQEGIGEDATTTTPVAKSMSKRCVERMLSAESPLKLVDQYESDEDNFEADLKLLTIPMLNEIEEPEIVMPSPVSSDPTPTTTPTVIPSTEIKNLDFIRAKLNAKRYEGEGSKESDSNDSKERDLRVLIRNIQSLISEEEGSKDQATELLQKLCKTLHIKNPLSTKDEVKDAPKEGEDPTQQQQKTDNVIAPKETNSDDAVQDEKSTSGMFLQPQPPTIKREGTFDIDLMDKHDSVNSPNSKRSIGEESDGKAITEISQCMISSSATYDADDTNVEKEQGDLNLPEIEAGDKLLHVPPPPPPMMVHSPDPYIPSPISPVVQPDVNEIVEQLSKLLAQKTPMTNNVTQQPTVIVVMNTPTSSLPKQNLLHTFSMEPSPGSTSHHQFVVGSPRENISGLDREPESSEPRRRSQSLSIHDKLHIFQLPLPSATLTHTQTALEKSSTNLHEPTPSSGDDYFDFKTPSRLLRRNSYSNGSRIGNPASSIGARRSIVSSDGGGSNSLPTRTYLETSYEGVVSTQGATMKSNQNAKPPPSSSFSKLGGGLHGFKPEAKLRKPMRQSSESIMSSTRPLKATIPVKKVAPLLMTEVSPSHSTGSASTFRSGGHLSVLKVGTSINDDHQLPRACSTPAVSSASTRRNSFSVSSSSVRSRHSLASSASPISRSSNGSSSGGGGAASSFGSSNRIIDSGLKRRSLTDFKAKSPIKARVSSSTMSKVAAAQTTAGKLSNVRAADKLKVVKETGRITNRLNGTLSTYRNKENRRP